MSAHPSEEQLSAFLDQELPEAVRLSIEEHLGTCDVCAAHLAELASVDEAARSLPLQEPAGYFDDFASRVRGRLAARPTRRALPVWSWAAAAAVLLAVVTPLALRERSAQAPAATVQKEAPARSSGVVSPPVAAKPQAPPAGDGAGAMTEGADRGFADSSGRRANEAERQDRRDRRDRPAESAFEFESRLSQDKGEAAAEPPRPAATMAPPARLEEQAAEKPKSLGYAVPPPASSQRSHGPRSQQSTPPPPPAVPAPADEAFASSAPAVGGTLDGLRDTDVAQEKDDRFAPAKRSAAPAPEAAAAGGAAAETRLGATAELKKSAPAPNADEARRRREAFRRMAGERPGGASADEARVGTIEEGVRAYRLEGRPEDRAIAERDGRAYLARPDARQAPRVRALLKELEETR